VDTIMDDCSKTIKGYGDAITQLQEQRAKELADQAQPQESVEHD